MSEEINKENKDTQDHVKSTVNSATNEKAVQTKKTEPIILEENKFIEKGKHQVNKILKELDSLKFHGSKIELSDEIFDNIVNEIREQSNLSKKQFTMNTSNKDFGQLTTSLNKVIREIKILGELSNKHSGEYKDEHVNKIFNAIKKKTNETKKSLKEGDKKEDEFDF